MLTLRRGCGVDGRRQRGSGFVWLGNVRVKVIERGWVVGAGMGEGARAFGGFRDVGQASDDFGAANWMATVWSAHEEVGVKIFARAEEIVDDGGAVGEMAEGVFDGDAFVVGDAFGGADASDEGVERGAVGEEVAEDGIIVELGVGINGESGGGGVRVARMWRR